MSFELTHAYKSFLIWRCDVERVDDVSLYINDHNLNRDFTYTLANLNACWKLLFRYVVKGPK